MRQLHGALTRVLAHASLMARPLSSELIAEVDPPRPPRSQPTSVEEIQQRVAERFGISRAELVGSSRAATPLARPPGRDLPHPRADRPLAAPDRPPLRRPRSLHRPQLAAPRRSRLDEDPSLPSESTSCAAQSTAPPASSADGRRRCKNPQPSHSRLHSRKPRRTRRIHRRPRLFPQALTQLKKASINLKLTTKREELVSKLSVVSRAVSTRAATQALSGVLLTADERPGDARRHRSRPRPARPTLDAEVESEGTGAPARPPARRGRALARRRDGRDRVARGRARRRDPQRRLQLPPAHPAGRGLPEAAPSAEASRG